MTLWRPFRRDYTGPGANAICLRNAKLARRGIQAPAIVHPLRHRRPMLHERRPTPCAGSTDVPHPRKPLSRDHRMSDTVVTRFAPSPTGYLHIGGARTALFNWLFARHNGGKILLRIEDTDRERSTEAGDRRDPRRAELARPRLGRRADLAVRARRAPRRGRPGAAARAARPIAAMLRPEELDADAREGARRAPAAALRQPLARPRPVRGAGRRQAGRSASRRRARARRSSTTTSRARSRFPNNELDDFILLRSDGTPTYMLAVVVDDHDMGVTHIIRGDDHLNNAFRQTHHLRRDGLGRAGHRPHPADPRPRRRQAVQAPRRARRRGLSRRWATCPRRCSTISRASAGAMATTRSSTDDMIAWFDLDHVGKGRRASTSRSSRTLNGHLHPRGRRRAARRLRRHPALSGERRGDRRPARRQRQGAAAAPPCPSSRRAPRPERAGRRRRLPVRRRARWRSTRRPRRCSTTTAARVSARRARSAAGGRGDWTRRSAGGGNARRSPSAKGLKLGKLAQPLRAALTGRTHLARHFRRAGPARPRREPGRIADQID